MISGQPDNSDIRVQIDWSNETKTSMNPFKMISYHQKLVHKNLQEHIASFFIPSIGYT